MTSSSPRQDAAFRLVETSRLLRAVVEQRLRPHGMTRAQFSTLSRLDRQDGLAQHELADALEVQPIAMVRLVDQLSEEGLVERRPDAADRRVNRLHITEAGRTRIRSLGGLKDEIGAELFDGIGEADVAHMLRILERLHANLKSIQADAAQKPRKSGT